jgi:hypothetical protein
MTKSLSDFGRFFKEAFSSKKKKIQIPREKLVGFSFPSKNFDLFLTKIGQIFEKFQKFFHFQFSLIQLIFHEESEFLFIFVENASLKIDQNWT